MADVTKRKKTRRGKRGGKKHRRPDVVAEPVAHEHLIPMAVVPRAVGSLRSRLRAIRSTRTGTVHG